MRTILFRVKGTVILKIWWQILLVSLYAAAIVCAVKFWLEWELNHDYRETTVGIFGLFTGFLLVFRTSTAYDRYWEGRKLWSSMTCNIRILTRLIWTMVPVKKLGEPISNLTFLEKVSTINLLVAFAYATRNFLREDYSYDEKDLKKYMKHVPKPSKNKHLIDDDDPNPTPPYPSIPIEISHLVMNFIKNCHQQGLVDEPTTKNMDNAINNLVECVGEFEKIVRTPIPMAYSVHLHHATWLYFLALPYQLLGVLDWFTIPVVALAAFAMLGILEIGWEIENPFGYDDNDLPLDSFCEVIQQEVLDAIVHPMPPAEAWILSKDNFPLMPESCLAAGELANLSEADIREILAKYGHQYGSCTKNGVGK